MMSDGALCTLSQLKKIKFLKVDNRVKYTIQHKIIFNTPKLKASFSEYFCLLKMNMAKLH